MVKSDDLYEGFIDSSGVSIDSRTLIPDNIFFAIKGENFDGHDFISQACEKGARYIVSEKQLDFPTKSKVFLVNSTLKTLQDIARIHRRKCNPILIAITGSNGKTTTKELISRVLSKKYETHTTIGNFNNNIGVPLTLLSMSPNTQISVIEMGASAIGEIKQLCDITEPNWGYITNFGKAHLEGFGSIEGVVQGKTELYRYLNTNNGNILLNLDDATQKIYSEKLNGVKTFGSDKSATFKLLLKDISHANITITQDNKYEYLSQLYGSYNASNISVAITFGLLFGVKQREIQDAILGYRPDNNRSQIIEKDGVKYVLDAYNANPDSMKVALDEFLKINPKKSGVILGDMLELGKYSCQEHNNVINRCLVSNLGLIYLVGKEYYKNRVISNRIKYFETTSQVRDKLNYDLKKLRIKRILLKGSRSLMIEKVLRK